MRTPGIGIVADHNGAVREPQILREHESRHQAVLGESAVADIRNALQMLRGPGLDLPSIERRLRSALGKIEVKECDHEAFVAHSPPVGGRWDDHTNEAGRCASCGTWLVRTTWATRRDPDYTAMRPEQIERMQSFTKGDAR